MPQENEIVVSVQGTEVVETITTTKSETFDKAEYLAQKEAELVAHDAGVQSYIDSQADVRKKLVALINEIK